MNTILFKPTDFPGAFKTLVKKGTCLLFEGDESQKTAYYIVSGSVEVLTECMDGTQTLLYTLSEGSLFGELCFMDVETRTASTYAAEDCSLLKINQHVWNQSMKNTDSINKVYQMLLYRFLETNKVVARLGQSSVSHRLCTYFLTLPSWKNNENSITIELPTHVQLARMLNCTRERITVVLKHLHKSGVLEKTDDKHKTTIFRSRLNELCYGILPQHPSD